MALNIKNIYLFNVLFLVLMTVSCNEFKVKKLVDESECISTETSPIEFVGKHITFKLKIENIEKYALVIDFVDNSINGEFSALETNVLEPIEFKNFKVPIYFQNKPSVNGKLLEKGDKFLYTFKVPECFKDDLFFLK